MNTVEKKWRSICMTPGNLRAAMYAFSSLITQSLETMSKILYIS